MIRQLPQFFGCIAIDNAATGINQWAFRGLQHAEKSLALAVIQVVVPGCMQTLPVTWNRQQATPLERPGPILYIFG